MKNTRLPKYGFGTTAMKHFTVCERCKSLESARHTVCEKCGAKLPKNTLYDLYRKRHDTCERCGVVLSNLMDFCPRCGQRKKKIQVTVNG